MFGIYFYFVDRNWGYFWNDLIYFVFFNFCVVIGEVGIDFILKCFIYSNCYNEICS